MTAQISDVVEFEGELYDLAEDHLVLFQPNLYGLSTFFFQQPAPEASIATMLSKRMSCGFAAFIWVTLKQMHAANSGACCQPTMPSCIASATKR